MDSTVPPSEAVAASAATEDKTVAIISYVTIFGFLAAIFLHQNRKTRLGAFHLRQMLGLVLTAIAGAVCGIVPILGWLVWFVVAIGVCVLWFIGFLSALQGETRPVPILGERYQEWLAGAFA